MGDEVSIHKNAWEQVRQYISDVRSEMKRVTWPGKQEIYGTTVMVILTTFFFGIYFYICDQIFGRAVISVMNYFRHLG
jgi:preprotein translocase subunit SecE